MNAPGICISVLRFLITMAVLGDLWGVWVGVGFLVFILGVDGDGDEGLEF